MLERRVASNVNRRRRIAGEVRRTVIAGDHRAAACCFVDYWNGAGSWSALRPEIQADLARYIPKACLEFAALIDERMPLAASMDDGCWYRATMRRDRARRSLAG